MPYVVEILSIQDKPDSVAERLAERFGVSTAKAKNLMRRMPGVVTKPVSKEAAEKAAVRFSDVGLEVIVREAEPNNEVPAKVETTPVTTEPVSMPSPTMTPPESQVSTDLQHAEAMPAVTMTDEPIHQADAQQFQDEGFQDLEPNPVVTSEINDLTPPLEIEETPPIAVSSTPEMLADGANEPSLLDITPPFDATATPEMATPTSEIDPFVTVGDSNQPSAWPTVKTVIEPPEAGAEGGALTVPEDQANLLSDLRGKLVWRYLFLSLLLYVSMLLMILLGLPDMLRAQLQAQAQSTATAFAESFAIIVPTQDDSVGSLQRSLQNSKVSLSQQNVYAVLVRSNEGNEWASWFVGSDASLGLPNEVKDVLDTEPSETGLIDGLLTNLRFNIASQAVGDSRVETATANIMNGTAPLGRVSVAVSDNTAVERMRSLFLLVFIVGLALLLILIFIVFSNTRAVMNYIRKLSEAPS